MKKLLVLMFTSVLMGSIVACTSPVRVSPTPESVPIRDWGITEIKSICLDVSVPETRDYLPNYRSDIEEATSEISYILDRMGYEVLPPGSECSAELTFHLEAEPLKHRYVEAGAFSGGAGDCIYGYMVSGKMELSSPDYGTLTYEIGYLTRESPPSSIVNCQSSLKGYILEHKDFRTMWWLNAHRGLNYLWQEASAWIMLTDQDTSFNGKEYYSSRGVEVVPSLIHCAVWHWGCKNTGDIFRQLQLSEEEKESTADLVITEILSRELSVYSDNYSDLIVILEEYYPYYGEHIEQLRNILTEVCNWQESRDIFDTPTCKLLKKINQ